MQSLQTIKRRLKSVKNIGQITKAMELVAATKMRKSQEAALYSRPYVFTALEILRNVSRDVDSAFLPELLSRRDVKKTAYVVVASDKGLTGAFNANVFRRFESEIAAEKTLTAGNGDVFIAVGEKARLYLQKKNVKHHAAFARVGDFIKIEEVKPIADLLRDGYLEKKWDRAVVFYTSFKGAMRQEVIKREILPIDVKSIEETARDIIPESGRFHELLLEKGLAFFSTSASQRTGNEYLIEPSGRDVLNLLLPHLLLMQVYHIVLEANASEHSSRRLAMKNASDNASDLSGALTLEYNKSRQAAITKELIEITLGAGAFQ